MEERTGAPPGLRNKNNALSASDRLQKTLDCALKVILHTTATDGEGAELPLSQGLLDLLHALQPPEPTTSSQPGSLSAQPVLRSLRHSLGSAVLDSGAEHDAAEAFDLLAQALSAELAAGFAALAKPHLTARAALRSILNPTQQQTDALLAGWRSIRLPCEGHLAHHMQCLRCRHHFTTQHAPFTTLLLPLPVSPTVSPLGVAAVPPGTSLAHCFEQIFRYELVQGVECPACSIKASLEDILGPCSPPPKAREKESSGEKNATSRDSGVEAAALAQLQRCAASGAPLPSEHSIAAAFGAAGVPLLKQHSPATRQSSVSLWPPLLALHLRRSFWTPTGLQVKVCGHVRAPLRLQVAVRGAASSSAYLLVAVVEHSGLSAGTGHYVTYRNLGIAKRTAETPPRTSHVEEEENKERSGEASKESSAAAQHSKQDFDMHAAAWVRVSDESVSHVEVEEVLEADAAMLFYEMEAPPVNQHSGAAKAAADSPPLPETHATAANETRKNPS